MFQVEGLALQAWASRDHTSQLACLADWQSLARLEDARLVPHSAQSVAWLVEAAFFSVIEIQRRQF
jgi:hypothetical protein